MKTQEFDVSLNTKLKTNTITHIIPKEGMSEHIDEISKPQEKLMAFEVLIDSIEETKKRIDPEFTTNIPKEESIINNRTDSLHYSNIQPYICDIQLQQHVPSCGTHNPFPEEKKGEIASVLSSSEPGSSSPTKRSEEIPLNKYKEPSSLKIKEKEWEDFKKYFYKNVVWINDSKPKLESAWEVHKLICMNIVKSLETSINQTSNSSLKYFTEIRKGLNNLLMSIGKNANEECGNWSSTLPLIIVKEDSEMCTNLHNLCQYMDEVLVPEMKKINDDAKSFIQKNKKRIDDLDKKTEALKSTIDDILKNYLVKFDKAEMDRSKNRNLNHELWVKQRDLHLNINCYKEKVREWGRLLENLWKSAIELMENNALYEKSIHDKYFIKRSKVFNLSSCYVNYKIEADIIEEITRNFGVAQLIHKKELEHLNHFSDSKIPITLDNLDSISQIQMLDILQSNIELIPDSPGSEYICLKSKAERKGGIVLKDWIKCFLILTEADCLHVMKNEDSLIPIASFYLDETIITLKSKTPEEVIISFQAQKMGFLFMGIAEELRITEDLSEWATALKIKQLI